MFMINQGKHTVEEIDGVRCTIVETGANEARVKFLKNLLELNKLEVKVAEDKKPAVEGQKTYTVGVTDLIFFPTVAIYERSLFTPEGHHVTPAYWKQYTTVCDPRYWRKHGKPSNKA
jgi:hypothetical protein